MMVYASYLSSCRVLYFHKGKFDIYKSRSICSFFFFFFFWKKFILGISFLELCHSYD